MRQFLMIHLLVFGLSGIAAAQAPDQAKPDQVRPTQSVPDQAKPDQAKPDQVKAAGGCARGNCARPVRRVVRAPFRIFRRWR